MKAELVEINGGPGLVFSGAGRVIATVTFDFDEEGRIATIHNVANPDKLGAVGTGAPYSSARGEPVTVTVHEPFADPKLKSWSPSALSEEWEAGLLPTHPPCLHS